MFESVVYEDILKRMLDRVPNSRNKREGAVIYDATSPAAIELQNAFLALDGVLNESFADTASLPYMKLRAKERNVEYREATSATLKAVSTPSDINVPIGSRFSLETLNYIVTEKITDGEYKVVCETAGAVGNTLFGSLIPIEHIDKLETIELTEVLVPGQDAEDVEELRQKYFESISSQAYGGNIADYREKAKTDGVGGVKVTPTWNGGGTVKLTLIDSLYKSPSEELIQTVQEKIDPVGNQGQGYGLAPIGHVVTVEGAEEVVVNIETDITYANGWAWDSAASYIKDAVDSYFSELGKGWDDTNDTALIVRISQIESAILQSGAGVIDISGTKLNGEESNLHLTKYQIATRGSINGE